MNTKTKLCALAIPLALAACSGRSGAEKAVREALKDPDSAKFGEFYYNGKTGKACLTTNAKNSMGGYTGDSQSQLVKKEDGWQYAGNVEESPEDCHRVFADGDLGISQADAVKTSDTGSADYIKRVLARSSAGDKTPEGADDTANRMDEDADRLSALADKSSNTMADDAKP